MKLFSNISRPRGAAAGPGRRGRCLAFMLAACLMVAGPSAWADQEDGSSLTRKIHGPEEFLSENQVRSLTGTLLPLSGQVVVTVETDPPIVLRADRIESDIGEKINHFVGNVSITRGDETVTADRALWHDGTNTAEVSGNLRIATPDFIILADRAVINLDLQMAKIYDGRAFFPARNYYISGAVIERLGGKTIEIRHGVATTCDGPDPAWTIEADRLTVTEGGYATASGMSFNTSYSPIVALPYFMFPVKNERQSGLLFPMVNHSSRDGMTAALPFFWASGENHDFTYTPVWRDKRGLSNTLEGRFHFQNGRGVWQMTYLNDHDPQEYSYTNTPDNIEKTRERYWLRAQNQFKAGDWDINLNLDLASDPLYLAEFRGDPDGFRATDKIFSRNFGYTVNEYLDPLRSNTLFAQRTGYDSFFRGGLEYTQNLYSENNRDTIQRLPSLRYNLVSRPVAEGLGQGLNLANLPRLSLDMRYDYFSRLSNDESWTDEEGHRLIVKPTISWSSPVAGLATFGLEGDLSLTAYDVSGHRAMNNPANPVERRAARHDGRDDVLSGSLTASLSTTLSRVYGGFGEAVAVRHQMTPTVSFTYVEAPGDQRDMPYWDYLDRRLSRRTMRYGLMNTFVSKTPAFDEDGQQTGYDYFQFLKLGLWSSYELRDNMDLARNPLDRYHTVDYYDRGAGPIEVEIEAFFNESFSARLVSGINGRTGKVTSHDLSLKAANKRGDSLVLTYDFDSPSTAMGTGQYEDYEEIRADLGLVLSSDWRADISTRYDLRAGKNLETHARLLYQAQCYGIGFMYTETDSDRRVGLVVDLLGLGSINADRPSLASPPRFFYD